MILLLLPVVGLIAQPQGPNAKQVVELSLELRQGDGWQSVDAHTVFRSNDEIRFRFRTFFPGYLYVLNHSSDGESRWLFPRPEQGQRSRVELGPEYLVPGTKGSFVIGGKPGFDVTYWVVSPMPIDSREPSLPEFGSQPSTLLPRCRTENLSARGPCVDNRAGPGPVERLERVPIDIPSGAPLTARDLTFRTDGESTRISAPDAQNRIIVYEFRIAHR